MLTIDNELTFSYKSLNKYSFKWRIIINAYLEMSLKTEIRERER